jgi:recombination protein RecR
MADSILDQLSQSFKRFPGIGPRQAKRFVYYLLRAPRQEVENLLSQIRDLKTSVNQCRDCGRFFPKSSVDQLLCQICGNTNRDASTLMLVEKDIDLENIERSGTYKGYYFVLGGLVPILDKNPEQAFRSRELLSLIKSKENLKEIIIAVSANTEGDHTAEYLRQFLISNFQFPNLKISTLGRGLSTGTELEYSDSDTLKNALKHRE